MNLAAFVGVLSHSLITIYSYVRPPGFRKNSIRIADQAKGWVLSAAWFSASSA